MSSEQQARWGTLYGVGVGPGAPDLLTLRAVRILRSCPVIYVPARTGEQSYAAHIIAGQLDQSRQEICTLQFPMRCEPRQAVPARLEAAQQVLTRLSTGSDVAFVSEGDPLLYSTFGYLLEIVKAQAPQVAVQIIPGITSVTAAAASARLPLASWDEQIAILPAVHVLARVHRSEPGILRAMLQSFDTIVLLKIHTVFDTLLDILEQLDLVQHAIVVRRCSTEQEEVIFDIARLRRQPLEYFSLMIVRKPYATGNA